MSMGGINNVREKKGGYAKAHGVRKECNAWNATRVRASDDGFSVFYDEYTTIEAVCLLLFSGLVVQKPVISSAPAFPAHQVNYYRERLLHPTAGYASTA